MARPTRTPRADAGERDLLARLADVEQRAETYRQQIAEHRAREEQLQGDRRSLLTDHAVGRDPDAAGKLEANEAQITDARHLIAGLSEERRAVMEQVTIIERELHAHRLLHWATFAGTHQAACEQWAAQAADIEQQLEQWSAAWSACARRHAELRTAGIVGGQPLVKSQLGDNPVAAVLRALRAAIEQGAPELEASMMNADMQPRWPGLGVEQLV